MSDKYNTGPDDIVASVADLERRLSALERLPSLQSASVDSGGITIREGAIRVLDNLGNIRIKMGKLDDGSYDITAYSADGLSTVNLAQLAFGEQAAFDTSNGSTTTNGYVDLTGTGVGPAVTCIIGSSGRAKISIGCQMESTFTSSSGAKCAMSFVLSGANTAAAANDRALVAFDNCSTGGTQHYIMRASYIHFLSGLNPGSTTFTAKYSSGSSGTTANFSDRTIIVEPF